MREENGFNTYWYEIMPSRASERVARAMPLEARRSEVEMGSANGFLEHRADTLVGEDFQQDRMR
ncbi:MAG: hypothetical protein IKU73_05365, partial [Clostridia bacterium]|nr:hypothetical protein [Clostridia bacterium]